MKYFRQIFIIFIGCIIVLAPSFNSGLFELYNEKRILEGVILIISSIYFIKVSAKHRLNLSKKTSVLLFTLLFILVLNSLLFSKFSSWSILEIGWYIALVQLVFVLSQIYLDKPEFVLKTLFVSLFLMALLYSIRVSFTVVQAHLDPEWAMWPRINNFKLVIDGEVFGYNPFIGFENFRFLNHLHTWSLPIMIGGYLKFRKELIPGFQILSLFILSIWWSLIFASGARGTSLGLLVSLIFVLIIYKKEAFNYLQYFILTACFGLIIYFLGFELFHEKGAHTIIRGETQNRLDLWLAAYNYIIQYPIFGLGPMHFSDLGNSFQISSPHNMYLLWAAEWGLPALFLLIFGGALLFKNWIKYSRIEVTILNISLTASKVAVLVHSNVSGIFITPLSQLLGCFVLAVMVGKYYKEQDESIFSPVTDSKLTQKLIVGALLVLNIVTYSIFISHIPDLKDRRENFLIEMKENRMYPRFWDQGFIGND